MLGDQGHQGHDAGGSRPYGVDADTGGLSWSALVGRTSAVAVLDRAVGEAAAGRGGLVFITGEAGIGKTALARHMAQHALKHGVLVLWGSCREGPGVPGFWPWVEVLRAYAEQVGRRRLSRQLDDAASGLAGLVPELGPGPAGPGMASAGPGVGTERAGGGTGPPPAQAGTGAADRFRMFDAVATLLRRGAAARPLLVVLDDLQWADAGTVRLLRFLVPDLPRSRLLVVGAYRDEEVEAPGHRLRGLLAELAARATLLPLAGLSAAEVAALMVQTGGAPPDPELAAAVHRRTGGNPFFVQQVTQLTSLAAGAPGPVPAGVREAIERRLARLPQACAELLGVASVAGAELRPELLAQVLGRSPGEVARLLEVAFRARILTRSASTGPAAAPGRFGFTHDLFRECLYQELEGSARRRLHARLAAALEALGPPGRPGLAAELARHCALAVPEVRAAAALEVTRRAAAEATGRLAHEEAAGYYAQAVRLAGLAGDPVARRGLLLELAEAHLRAGDLGEARARFLDAAAEARTADDAATLASAALGVHRVGSRSLTTHADSIRLLQEAWAVLDAEDGDPTRAGMRARVLACLARDLVHGVGQDHARAVALSDQAVTLARTLDDPATLALCLFAHHDALWVAGSAERRLPVVAEMATAARAAGDAVLGLEARLARFVALLELGDPEAFVAFNEAARAAEELRQPHYQWMVRSRRAALALLAGRLGEAKRLIGQATTLAERIGEPDGRNVAFAQRQELTRLRGGALAILAALRAAMSASAKWDEAVRQSVQTWIEVLELLARLPDAGYAHDLAAVVRARLEPSVAGVIGWQQLEQRSGLAEVAAEAAAVDAGAVADIADRAYQALLPSAASMVLVGGAVVCKDPVAYHLGALAAALGRWDQAVDHLRDAIDRAQRLGARPSLARGRCELGRVLLARGRPADRAQAEQLLRQAADAAGELGLRALAERATATLAALAPRRQPSGPGRNLFRRDGEVWTLGYAGTVVRLPDAKGLHDIARLLAHPGVEIPAADLVGPAARLEAALGADPTLDAPARAAYRRRLAELAVEIDAADADHDPERAARARAERDTLVEGLSAAYGLGRRARRLGDAGERARKAVTARIRDSLARLDRRHPVLAQHLRQSIHTGAICSYQPPQPTPWELGEG